MPAVGGAVIAAAGLGSRLGHGLPKCMLEIEGQTILSRLVTAIEPHIERIQVVVGYREEMVIEHLAAHHRHVVVVRNPEFRSTNTITSMVLGARGLAGRLLFVDGDTVIRPASLARFLDLGSDLGTVLGVAEARSDDGVYVDVDGTADEGVAAVRAFSRLKRSRYEWANTLLADVGVLAGTGFVFESLEPLLPLPAIELDLVEVDTEKDLARARATVASWRE